MGKTFDQSLIDTAKIPMSMIDPDDMEDKTSEEFASMRRVQQGCHSELTNREDFPFNQFTKNIQIAAGTDTYTMPQGRITKVRLSDGNTIRELEYSTDLSLLPKKSGKPEKYTVTYNPNKLKFYPAPDGAYNVSIDYNSTRNVIYTDGTYGYEIANDSTLKMPEQFQHLYFDALEYYVLYTNMRKVSNPRWQPTYEIFKQKWATFLRGARSIESETYFVI